MATDPIRRIRERTHATTLDLDAEHALLRFAALPPSEEAPYLTVYLDWRPEGDDPGRRLGQRQVERDLDDIVARHGPRGAAFVGLRADSKRLRAYLAGELDSAALPDELGGVGASPRFGGAKY